MLVKSVKVQLRLSRPRKLTIREEPSVVKIGRQTLETQTERKTRIGFQNTLTRNCNKLLEYKAWS